jgi:hypothetical protein
VRSVVVEHEMNIEMVLHAPVDLLEELDEFPGAMARLAFADDEAALHIERGKQRGRAVTLVVMGHGRGAALYRAASSLRPSCFAAIHFQAYMSRIGV